MEPAALPAALPHPMPPGPEPHPHPHAGLRLRVHLLGHGVVEVPVEVQHALVDQHPGDGPLLGERGPRQVRGLARGALAWRTLSRMSASCSGGAPLGPAAPVRPGRPVLAAHACILTKPH